MTAPSENELAIATRLRDTAFKRVFRQLKPGDKFLVDGPFGSFTLHRNTAKPAVFLAGGIGITPFHSIIKHAAENALPHKITLFFSNRRPEDAPFLKELQTIATQYPNFKLVVTMTEMEKSKQSWNSETGFIDASMLQRHLPSLTGPIYYAAGPPEMVNAMQKMLEKAQIDPDDIRTEGFDGY